MKTNKGVLTTRPAEQAGPARTRLQSVLSKMGEPCLFVMRVTDFKVQLSFKSTCSTRPRVNVSSSIMHSDYSYGALVVCERMKSFRMSVHWLAASSLYDQWPQILTLQATALSLRLLSSWPWPSKEEQFWSPSRSTRWLHFKNIVEAINHLEISSMFLEVWVYKQSWAFGVCDSLVKVKRSLSGQILKKSKLLPCQAY